MGEKHSPKNNSFKYILQYIKIIELHGYYKKL